MDQVLVAPLVQPELSSELPARSPRPPASLTYLSQLSNATVTLIPPHVFLSCPQVLSSPSGTSLIITEARNTFNLGHLRAQSGNYFCLFALTLPSSFADLSHLPFQKHFPLQSPFPFPGFAFLIPFMDCPSLPLGIFPVFSRCFIFTFEGVFPLPSWWMTLETPDLFTVG